MNNEIFYSASSMFDMIIFIYLLQWIVCRSCRKRKDRNRLREFLIISISTFSAYLVPWLWGERIVCQYGPEQEFYQILNILCDYPYLINITLFFIAIPFILHRFQDEGNKVKYQT
jgi:flagellar biogenesis protein FliO